MCYLILLERSVGCVCSEIYNFSTIIVTQYTFEVQYFYLGPSLCLSDNVSRIVSGSLATIDNKRFFIVHVIQFDTLFKVIIVDC